MDTLCICPECTAMDLRITSLTVAYVDGPRVTSEGFDISEGGPIETSDEQVRCAQCGWEGALSEARPSVDVDDAPRFDRFDICEAWWVWAHYWGEYAVITRLQRMGFRPRLLLERNALTDNGLLLYMRLDRRSERDVNWYTRQRIERGLSPSGKGK